MFHVQLLWVVILDTFAQPQHRCAYVRRIHCIVLYRQGFRSVGRDLSLYHTTCSLLREQILVEHRSRVCDKAIKLPELSLWRSSWYLLSYLYNQNRQDGCYVNAQ